MEIENLKIDEKTIQDLKKENIIKNDGSINRIFKFGKIKILKNTAKIITANNQEIFIDLDDLHGAYEDDFVVVRIIFNPKGKLKGKIFKIIKKSNKEILAYFNDNNFYSIQENMPLKNIKYNLKLKNFDLVIIQNQKVIKKIDSLNNAKIDEFISLFLYNEHYRLKNQNFKIKKPNEDKRVDLTNLDFVTIDPVEAKDFDDAVYFDEKNETLFVAIADVSSYIKNGSDIDNEAAKRGFTVYLPHKAYPMLPEILSNDLCSLKPNKERFAYVCKIKFDSKKLKVLESEFFEAKILSKERFTYEEIDELIRLKKLPYNLDKLLNLVQKFRKKRLKNGFEFNSVEIKLVLDENFNLVNTVEKKSTLSHQLIEECMLLSNIEAAKKLKQTGIFRTHDEPDLTKLQNLINNLSSIKIKAKLKANIHSTIESIQHKAIAKNLENEVNELLIQAQAKAKYSFVKMSHFGLGFEEYSHFTSPIRRYSDLILHRLLKTKYKPNDIEQLIEFLNTQEQKIDQLCKDFNDRIYARFAKKNLNKIFKAKIIDIIEPKAKIIEFPHGLVCNIKNYNLQPLFLNVKIKLVEANIITKVIYGEII